MTVGKLAAVEQWVRADPRLGVAGHETRAHPEDVLGASARAELARLVRPDAHYPMPAAVSRCPAGGWPLRAASASGLRCWLDAGALDALVVAQPAVCGRILTAKLALIPPRFSYSGSTVSAALLPGRDELFVFDGHHSLALQVLARLHGLVAGPLPVWVHGPGRNGLAVPRLDCDCPRRA